MKYSLLPGLVLCLLLEFIVTNQLSAQAKFKEAVTNFKEATVIDQAGDTLRGKIDYRGWLNNPQTIVFLQEGQKKDLSAKNIAEFRVGGDVYRSARVDLDVSPMDINRLGTGPNSFITKDTTLFLLVLVDADMSLLTLTDAAGKTHFFYQEKGQNVERLEYYRYYKDELKQTIVNKDIYRGQLKVISLACTQQQINYDIHYTSNDLISFFRQFNNCLSPNKSVDENVTQAKSKWEFFINGGVHFSKYNFSDHIYGRNNARTFSAAMPVIGLGVSYILPRTLGKYAVTATIVYNHVAIKQTYKIGRSWVMNDELSLNNVQGSVYFRYSIPFSDEVRPYISAGPTLGYYLNPTLHRKKDVINTEGKPIISQESEHFFSTRFIGGSLAVGAAWRRYTFEVRYYRQSMSELSSADNTWVEGTISSSNFSGIVSYRIF